MPPQRAIGSEPSKKTALTDGIISAGEFSGGCLARTPWQYYSDRQIRSGLPSLSPFDQHHAPEAGNRRWTGGELLLEYWRRPANPLPFQADIYFDTVGDFDERNAAVHAVVFAIEGHCARDAPGGCSLAVICNREFFCFRHATN